MSMEPNEYDYERQCQTCDLYGVNDEPCRRCGCDPGTKNITHPMSAELRSAAFIVEANNSYSDIARAAELMYSAAIELDKVARAAATP